MNSLKVIPLKKGGNKCLLLNNFYGRVGQGFGGFNHFGHENVAEDPLLLINVFVLSLEMLPSNKSNSMCVLSLGSICNGSSLPT